MDVSTPPSLDLASPQGKAKIDNHDNMFREREVSIKIKYRHGSIMVIIITAIYHHKTYHAKVTIHTQAKVLNINFIGN